MVQFLSIYLCVGAAFVGLDCLFHENFREVYKKHRIMMLVQIIRWPHSLFNRLKNKLCPPPDKTSGLKQNDSSFYRRWVANREPALQKQKSADYPMAFTGLMMFLGQLHLTDKRITPSPRETPAQLGDDAALFEAGCYLVSMIDRWIYGKHPERRETFIRYVMDEYIQLSSKALSMPIPEVATAFNLRMARYGELYRASKPGVEREIFERLTDYVTYAIENGSSFPGREAPMSLSMERLEVLMQLQIWATSHGSGALDSLAKLFSDKSFPLKAPQRRE